MASNKTHWSFDALLALMLLGLSSSPAFAQTIGSMADSTVSTGSFTGFLDLLAGSCYLIGAGFGIRTVGQLKEHTVNPGNVKLSMPLMSMVVTATLLAFPSLLSTLQATFDLTGDRLGNFKTMTAGGTVGGGGVGLDQIAVAFAANVPALAKFVSIGATCAGAFMIFRAIMLLPQVQQGRAEGTKVIWSLIAGIGLWSLLPMITAAMGSIGMAGANAPNLITVKYSQAGGGGFDGTIAAVLVFVQLLGLIAFVRGMLILKALGDHKEGVMGRALTHILGGACAMNIGFTIGMLARSIGANSVICGISVNLCN